MNETTRIYSDALKRGQRESGCNVAGCWTGNPGWSLSELLSNIERIEADASTMILKEDRRTRVMQASLGEHRVVLKRYQLTKRIERIKYTVRKSPARRFWAAAYTMEQLKIPTPKPLGFIEVFQGTVPIRSYVINEFMAGSVASREWIEPDFHKQTPAFKELFIRDMLNMLLLCYRHGLYHRDTKCENMLLQDPLHADERRFLWIDLECVQHRKPTRHDIIRNLVQLNGAVGLNITCDDRLQFLNELAIYYPWANQPGVVEQIKQWTAMRLAKEKVKNHE